MTFRTYTKKGVFFHAVYIAILTVSGILAVYSAVFGALHISCKEDKIALGFTVFFALLIISVDFFECRAMGARIYTNAEGIGVRRFGKTKVFIKWSEIKEAAKALGKKDKSNICRACRNNCKAYGFYWEYVKEN